MTPTALQSARTDLPTMLASYALVHDAMTRDTGRLVHTLDQPETHIDHRLLGRWFGRFAAEIVHHHQREDDIVFPALAQRCPGFAADAALLDGEHHELDKAMSAVATALADPRRTDAAEAAARLATVLVAHVEREEDATFARLAEHFSEEEYGAIEQQLMRATPLRLLSFEAPWVLEHLNADQRRAHLARVPGPLRLLYRLRFAPAYRRLDAALLPA